MVRLNQSTCLFSQSNVLEASPDMKRESEKEWYFGNADKERRGPFSFEEVNLLVKMLLYIPRANLSLHFLFILMFLL